MHPHIGKLLAPGLAALALGVTLVAAAPASAANGCYEHAGCVHRGNYWGHPYYGYYGHPYYYGPGPAYYAPGPAPIVGGIVGGLAAGLVGGPYYYGPGPYYGGPYDGYPY